MRLALVEDEQEELIRLRDLTAAALTNYGATTAEIACFSSSSDFFKAWQAGAYDIILLDIYMDSMNGIEMARKIRETDPQTALVFCTSSNDFAFQSYEVRAQDYLLKPITAEKLHAMLQHMDLAKMEANRSIQLPDGYRLLLRKLLYTNYINHVVTFYILNEEPYTIYTTQAEVERLLLHQKGFYAANKGSIINLQMVRRVTEDSVVLKDGSIVPIARRRYKEVREAYMKFRFEQLCKEADI